MTVREVTLIGKPGCHLCDDARAEIAAVVTELGFDDHSITLRELSILDDASLAERYADEIPVVLIDDRMHTYWRVDPDRLRAALC